MSEGLRAMRTLGGISHFDDPIGLARRVWSNGGRHGRMSMVYAAISASATPLDIGLEPIERRLTIGASPSSSMVIVCGPPRSGTTIMSYLLTIASGSSYVTNLMDMFPRAPLAASKTFRCRPDTRRVPLTSFYGRTAGIAAPSDGLRLWDKWVGGDRSRPNPDVLLSNRDAVVGFFGGLEEWLQKPVVTKNNSVNSIASAVASVLPTARFVCMERQPVPLARSLLVARTRLHGNLDKPYGVSPLGPVLGDPISDVARQVRFHQDLAMTAEAALGSSRFRTVSYEELCSRPRAVVSELVESLLGVVPETSSMPEALELSQGPPLVTDQLNRLEAAFM